MELTPEQKKFALGFALAWPNPDRMYDELYDAVAAEVERLHLTVAGDAIERERFRE